MWRWEYVGIIYLGLWKILCWQEEEEEATAGTRGFPFLSVVAGAVLYTDGESLCGVLTKGVCIRGT